MHALKSINGSRACSTIAVMLIAGNLQAGDRAPSVEGQPLAANAKRILQAFEFLGAPFDDGSAKEIQEAAKRRDAKRLQELLDQHVLFVVSLNPEVRVKVRRGPATVTGKHPQPAKGGATGPD